MAFIRFPVASRGALEVCGGVNRIRGQAGSEGGRDLRAGGNRATHLPRQVIRDAVNACKGTGRGRGICSSRMGWDGVRRGTVIVCRLPGSEWSNQTGMDPPRTPSHCRLIAT